MNRWLALLLALAVPLAGCLNAPDDTETAATDEVITDAAIDVPVPEPIEDTQTVIGSLDPLNFAGQPVCSTPNAACERYPFTLENTTKMMAELTWGISASDFDLYVFQNGEPVEQDGGVPPSTRESLDVSLPAGEYEIVVVAWAVAQDTYTLKATFEAVAAAPAEADASA